MKQVSYSEMSIVQLDKSAEHVKKSEKEGRTFESQGHGSRRWYRKLCLTY